VLGDIANGDPCGAPQRFVRKTLSSGSEQPLVTTDAGGAAWLLVGTDSGFEGSTRLYYTRFAATFSE